jgi:rod shape-determining protein MreC
MSLPFNKFTRGTLLLLCVILAVIFTSIALPNFDRAGWQRQAVLAVTKPLQSSVTAISGFLDGVWRHYIALTEAAKENDELKARLAEAHRTILELDDIKKENRNLTDMLSLSRAAGRDGIGARVIASNVTAEFKTAEIDKGYNHGIGRNMAVIGAGGLVGRVGRVTANGATILFISDPNSSADVFVQRSGARALLVGASQGVEARPFYSLSRLEYLRKASDVSDGDVVMTSGLDRVFPAGIPVGTVKDVETNETGVFRGARVVPFVDLQELKTVVVLRSEFVRH